MPRLILALALFFVSAFLCSCASTAAKNEPATAVLDATDSLALKKMASAISEHKPDLELSHGYYIKATELEMRGDMEMAYLMLREAYKADSTNRFLAFSLAEKLAMRGSDSLAFLQAKKASGLKGLVTESQLALLARLYAKHGVLDSCRKYFNLALDSSKNQDMALLYDYTLFLESLHDEKELVRVYDILLPRVNYMTALFKRQLELLVNLNRDSSIVDLFSKAHGANGDKQLLWQAFRGLVMQKRMQEARDIADTLTGSTTDDENMVTLIANVLAEKSVDSAFAFLKKKYYEDGVNTPVVLNMLGGYENDFEELDSAKVHLHAALNRLSGQPKQEVRAYRSLVSLSFKEKRSDDAVKFAEKADSVTAGGAKLLLASTYGVAEKYAKAYRMLDSLVAAWKNWTPVEGVVDSATLEQMKVEADLSYRQFMDLYAKILLMESQSIEEGKKSDERKMAMARENRVKAELLLDTLVAKDTAYWHGFYMMAMNLERLKRYEESFKIFEKLLKLPVAEFPERIVALNYYGYTLIDLNRSAADVERGLKMVLEALEMDKSATPSDAFLDSKAWGLYRLGRFQEAYEVMLAIGSQYMRDDDVYWEHLAAIQVALGMDADAKKSYKRLLQLKPNHPEALKFLNGGK